jgi:TonB-linked SusC/RagA family outer membrane protein
MKKPNNFRTAIISLLLFLFATTILAEVTVKVNNATIRQIISQIEKSSDYSFFYSDELPDLNKEISVNIRNENIERALNKIFTGTSITYTVGKDKQILLTDAKISNNPQNPPQTSRKNYTGIITDASTGEPIIGASIMAKGSTIGTATDLDGRFSLEVPTGTILIVSYIGYSQQEIKLGNNTALQILLQEDAAQLSEVIVVGYGTQKKVNLTGAVVQTDSKVFESRPVTSAVNALQGVMPGVQITPGTGNPNQDLGINIRGTTSVNGGDPLVLIDGIESSLKMLNPADIDNVSILKDAAASAIYGVRAAFGVVLITTKRGKAGKLNINYSNNIGWAQATYLPEFVDNSYDHAMFVNQSLTNNGAAPLYNAERMAGIEAYYKDPSQPNYIFVGKQYFQTGFIDWKEALIRNSTPRQTHNINISGGSDKTTFYASVAYHNQEGVLKINPDIYDRYNARLSVDNRNYDWLHLGFKAAYNTTKMDSPMTYANDVWRALLFSSPLNGGQWMGDPKYPEYDQYIGYYFQDQNMIPVLLYGGRSVQQQHEIVLTPSIDIMPLKNWNIHVDYNYGRIFSHDTNDHKHIDKLINNTGTGLVGYMDVQETANSQYIDYFSINQSQKNYYSFNAYTDYSVTAGKNNIKAMLGFNQEYTGYDYHSARRNWMINPDLPSLGLGTGDQTVGQSGYEVALRGGFGRLNYDYDGKYLVEIVGRYDGTSRFPKDRRFVFLPSASIGWRLSEEAFMSFAKPVFNNIKLRASYGTLGNQMLTSSGLGLSGNMHYYPYIFALQNGTSTSWLFGNDNTQKTISPPSQLPVSSLTWEKVSTLNAGIDLSLLNSRLNVEFDVYTRTTSDMLMSQTLPEVLGATAPKMNSGELRTDGWELSAKWRDNIGKDFRYGIGFSLFDSQAEITKWEGAAGTVTSNYEGKKIGEIWGYETVGFISASDFTDGDINKALIVSQSSIASNWKPGDIKYKDRNGDGVVNTGKNTIEDPGDRYIIGNSTPRYQYGINGDIQYKGFSLNLFLQGIGKKDFWNSTQEFFPMGTQYYNTQKHWFTDSWTPENTDAYFPLTRARSTQNQQTQTKYLQDGSYLRLKNLTIGYELPQALMRKIFLTRAQIYISGENLCEISYLVGPYDPESVYGSNGLGSGSYSYPFSRVYSLGINLTF